MKYLSVVLVCAIFGIEPLRADNKTCSTATFHKGSGGNRFIRSEEQFWKRITGGKLIDDLTDDNFDKWVENNPDGFVMYYTTRCPYARDAREGFGGTAKEMDGKVKFGSVDCENTGSKVCSAGCNAKTGYPRLGGYPTFHLFKDGRYADRYLYDRTKDMFVSWLSPRVKDDEP